jgi:hypothetical protein
MTNTMTGAPAASARSCLELLAEALGRRGLLARVTRVGDGPAYIEAINRSSPSLAESIFAARAAGESDWWFWWSWPQRIAPAADIERTADQVARVLATAA